MKNLYKALAAFQQEVPTIHKATKGYGYTYAELSTILEIINPILKRHNLGFTQLVVNSSIKTIVFHTETAEQLESIIDIPQGVTLKGMNDFQILGSAISYLRRYALSSALGLVTDKDTDASGEQTKQATTTQQPTQLIKLTIAHSKYKSICEKLAKGETTLEEIKKYFDVSECEEQLKSYVQIKKLI
jgi:hypothetical protein